MAKLISADLTNNKLCILEYTTTDGRMLSVKEDAFDAKIASHTYTDIGKVIFDKPITKIGDYAFSSCKSLTSVTIPDSVTTIRDYAFSACISLTSVTIPDSVTAIGESVFAYCYRLKEFKGMLASEDGRCLIIDGTLNTFAHAGLTEYTIPNSVTSIGKDAFLDCHSLTSVTIPDSVTEIGTYAFVGCSSLTSVTIPDSITIVGNSAFRGCSSLKEFNGKFATDSGRCLIVYGVLNAFAIGCGVTQYTIPDSVTTIGESAFYNCSNLTSVTIPNSVTTIGKRTFLGCRSLTSVTIPDSVTEIGAYAFVGCSSLTSVTIPDSVTTIGNWAFVFCSSLKSVIIGSSVNVIGIGAFRCNSLDIVVCCPEIPPKINDSFGKFENLIVPTGSEEAYTNSDWGQYLE